MGYKWKKFIIKLKWGLVNPLTVRDIALGILVNAIYDIVNNGLNIVNSIATVIALYAISEMNYKIRRQL